MKLWINLVHWWHNTGMQMCLLVLCNECDFVADRELEDYVNLTI